MMNGLNRIAIYTCITGGYDIPTDNFDHKDGYDYFLFSEAPIQTKSWKNLIASFNSESNLTVVKKQRFIKTHPFDILKDYDIVVWIDANTDVNEKLYKYIEENKDNLLTFKTHPQRDCIYAEIKECIKAKKETPEMGKIVQDNLKLDGYPEHNGLYETNIIISHPQNSEVKLLFRKWWEVIYKLSHRDQLSLNYVIWKNHLEKLVNAVKSNDFKPKIHKRNIVNNLDIFIGTHKTFEPKVSNNAYKIIVGNNKIENHSKLQLINCKHEDVLDDKFWSEIYMLKWIANNYKLKEYVGFCHYRKYWSFMDNIPDLDAVMKEHEIVVAKQLAFKKSIKEQYKLCHNIEDLYIITGILAEKYPDYIKTWNAFLDGNKLFPYNMFIMKREEFIEYAKFMKNILDEFINIIGKDIDKRIYDNYEKYIKSFYPNNSVDYQYRIGGYLAERLTNVWILKNHKKIGVAGVKITEDKYKKDKTIKLISSGETSGNTI